MRVLFYKGPGLVDRLIRVSGSYSHCEIEFSDGWAFSSSGRDGGVRFKKLQYTRNYVIYWDRIDITVSNEEELRSWAIEQLDAKYDWLGIIGTCLGCPLESRFRWFCSEICSTICKAAGLYSGSTLITPSELYRALHGKDHN